MVNAKRRFAYKFREDMQKRAAEARENAETEMGETIIRRMLIIFFALTVALTAGLIAAIAYST
jgi:hypothetical protein